MAHYVSYRASDEFKDRGQIPRRLRALGCRQIHRAFWEVEARDVNMVLKVLQKNQLVLLKRVREIRKPRFTKGESLNDIGSLIVMAYTVPKIHQEKVRFLLKKAPYIPLSRSVLAFSQNHIRLDKDRELVDARSFWTFISKIDEDVTFIPRVVISYTDSTERLLGQVKKRVENEIDSIVKGYKSLPQKISEGEMDERRVHSVLSHLKRRLATLRKVATFYEKWLKIDLSKSLIKPYPAMRKVRLIVNNNSL